MKLEITQENALKAYDNGCDDVKAVLENLFGKETFIPKNVTDRIKSFKDACIELGVHPDNIFHNSDTKDEAAYKKIKLIVRALNEGWTPDWNNSNQPKYWPWFKMSGSGLSFDDCVNHYSYSYVGSRLCFKSKELAEYAGKQFTNIYSEFMTL